MKHNRRQLTTAQVAMLMAVEKCCGKVSYSTRDAAMAAIAGMTERHGTAYDVYRCRRGNWHLTTKIGSRR